MIEQTNRRVLIVAYYFPPVGGIGSIRSAGFCRHLPEFGWEPVVLAPTDTPHARDESLSISETCVIRSRSVELSQLGRRATVQESASGPVEGDSRLRPALRSFAHRFLFYPDPQIGWYPGAFRAGLRALRTSRYDAIFSSSFPVTSHLVAGRLSKASGVPWIAEFRDPWSERLPRVPYRRMARRLERSIARRAARVIMPTPSWAAYFGSQWGREISVVLNGFDPLPESATVPGEPLLTHVGSYYSGMQDLGVVWDALATIRREDRSRLPRVRWIGELSEAATAELSQRGVEDLVDATGAVSHEAVRRQVGSSTMLFLSGAVGKDPVARGVIPGKLFEYLASDLPILYVGDPASDAAALLNGQPNCFVVAHDDVEGATAAILAGLATPRSDRQLRHLDRRHSTERLVEVLDSVLPR